MKLTALALALTLAATTAHAAEQPKPPTMADLQKQVADLTAANAKLTADGKACAVEAQVLRVQRNAASEQEISDIKATVLKP